MKRISSGQRRYVKPLVEAVVVKSREANARMTAESGSATRINLAEGIIKIITIITLETLFKRGKISGCATESARNVNEIILTTQGFMLSGSVIQALSVFRLIMNI